MNKVKSRVQRLWSMYHGAQFQISEFAQPLAMGVLVEPQLARDLLT